MADQDLELGKKIFKFCQTDLMPLEEVDERWSRLLDEIIESELDDDKKVMLIQTLKVHGERLQNAITLSEFEDLQEEDDDNPLNHLHEDTQDLMFEWLDESIKIRNKSESFSPAMISVADDEKSIQVFPGEDVESIMNVGIPAYINSMEKVPDRLVIAYDGFITVEGTRSDAIFVTAHCRGGDEAVTLAQRYRIKKSGLFRKGGIKAFGNPAFVETTANLLPPFEDD